LITTSVQHAPPHSILNSISLACAAWVESTTAAVAKAVVDPSSSGCPNGSSDSAAASAVVRRVINEVL